MLRDGRGPPGRRGADAQPLPPALAQAVASARLVAAGGQGMAAWERTARLAQVGAALAAGGGGGSASASASSSGGGSQQRAAVSAAVGTVRAAETLLRAHSLQALDTGKYAAALRAAREGSLMARSGGTPAALRRSMTARREALGV